MWKSIPLEGYGFPSYNNMGDLSQITTSINGEEPYDQYGAWAGVPIVILRAQFTVGSSTGIDENAQNDTARGRKVLRDGKLYIEYNGKTYNIMGAEIR